MPTLSNNNKDWFLVATVIKNLSSSLLVNLGRRFESEFLIVRVSTLEQKDTWSFGGRLWVTSLVLGKQSKIHQTNLELFEQELIQVPKLFTGKYSLLYQAPKWFKNVTIKVWEYRGEIDYSNDNNSPGNDVGNGNGNGNSGNNNGNTGGNGNNNSTGSNLITFGNLLI
ncbi:MAG: hypothetical protein QNJ70_29835 [Xenococcaceae cyanobacterium MO_207.B15]|nr:hypothetical protein [Xenococcaceae cyanobacterium MO_207.B15]